MTINTQSKHKIKYTHIHRLRYIHKIAKTSRECEREETEKERKRTKDKKEEIGTPSQFSK